MASVESLKKKYAHAQQQYAQNKRLAVRTADKKLRVMYIARAKHWQKEMARLQRLIQRAQQSQTRGSAQGRARKVVRARQTPSSASTEYEAEFDDGGFEESDAASTPTRPKFSPRLPMARRIGAQASSGSEETTVETPSDAVILPETKPFYEHPLFLAGAGVLGTVIVLKLMEKRKAVP